MASSPPASLAILAPVAFLGMIGCSQSASPPEPSTRAPLNDERPYLLERVDDAAVVQLYADGFAELPLREKILVWHLYQAAIAGRDIYYDQRYAHSLEMRDVLEAIVTHPAGIDPETLAEVVRYTKLFWINTGPYNNLTARKFTLTCTPEAFAAAAETAARAGATFPLASGESLEHMLARMTPYFFDANVDPMVTAKTPPPGKDILTGSANNLHVGVSMEDLDGFREAHPLNSRLVKAGDRLDEEVYKVGGRYGSQLSAIVSHLEAAMPFATEPMAAALKALVTFYRTGDMADHQRYDIAWVVDKSSPVDTINGFVEVYLDARGRKGAWESLVFYVNHEKTEGIRTLAKDAQWFEDHMPWDPKYRKPNVQGITANAIDVVVETGDSGPITPVGINLPNDQRVREAYGSKSVTLSNVSEAYDKSTLPEMRSEFSWSPEETARATKWSASAGELFTNLHEVIGHASGKTAERLKGQPETVLKEQYSALEEARADLVALYFFPDPRLAELGLLSAADQDEIVRAEYEAQTRGVLVQLRRMRSGTQLEEDHMRNRQMIIHWLIRNTKAVEVRRRDGKTYYVMTDAKAFRDGAGRLLAEVQRIKSEGDYSAAKALLETYGVYLDAALRDEVMARVDHLKLPSYTGFVMPRLQAKTGADGTIVDVAISYPGDLTKQMLEYLGGDQDDPATMSVRGINRRRIATVAVAGLLVACVARPLRAQAIATRLAILQAEARTNPSNYDLLVIKGGMRSNDVETVRLAVRTLGRLERPSQIPDLLVSLRHMLPEVRVEAANAIAQAAQGFRTLKTPPTTTTLASTENALIARLSTEDDDGVRAAICEALARLPYKLPADVARAESAILGRLASGPTSTEDRLGVAKGLEALFRIQRSVRPPGPEAIQTLKNFVREATLRPANELLRDARVRRLAVEGLTSAAALDEDTVTIAAADPDAQVRRLAMRGAAMSGIGMAKVRDGLDDPVPLVQLEALRALRSRSDDQTCDASLRMISDADMSVALVALDQLGACGSVPEAVAALDHAAADQSELNVPRGWHRNAHALVALASAAPDKASAQLQSYATSPIWQVRVYAARAAGVLKDRATLQRLATDGETHVANAAHAAMGSDAPPMKPRTVPDLPGPTTAELRRLASPRAVITIKDVGRFDLALITSEAPATVLRFAQLAESGYFNGLTFDRIAPNAIAQGGSRDGDDARYQLTEIGTWPHVRGTVGLSMPDTNDAQFFVDLVDNPRFDHQYPVFAQILNGADIVDELLEGDVIESILIVP